MKSFNQIAVSALLVATSVGQANAESFDDMHKQLDIMNNIMKSSLSSERNRSSRITIDSTYLKGQCVLFNVSSRMGLSGLSNYSFSFSMPKPPKAPKAPVAPVGTEDYEIHMEESISDALEMVEREFEVEMENYQHDREAYRELQESQRELAYELRDVAREVRDLEFQMRHADEKSKAELESERAEIEKQRAKYEASLRKVEKEFSELRKQQQTKKEQQQKDRAAFYDGLSTSLTETLCLYGNGLKALPKKEHVSFILKAGGERDGNRYKDRIMVFSKSDITAYSADKISAKKLVSSAQSYQF